MSRVYVGLDLGSSQFEVLAMDRTQGRLSSFHGAATRHEGSSENMRAATNKFGAYVDHCDLNDSLENAMRNAGLTRLLPTARASQSVARFQ